MQKPHQFLPTEEEETLVTPRFDDEETVVARRVVPLEEVGQAEPFAAQPAASAPLYTHEPHASRRSWSLALVVVSALVGGVFGGAGLYFYQSRASSPRATEAHAAQPTVAPTNAPAAPPEPTPAPTLEIVNSQPAAPPAQQNSGAQTDESDATPKGGASVEKDKDAVDSSEADERKADDERAAAPKRGKKGDRDEEIRRDERRARHSDSDDQLSRADDDDNAPVARRVDTITIFDRPRRASRRDRRRSDSDSDRLRRIFEGQPQ